MTTIYILMGFISFVLLFFAWLWPVLMAPTLPFGVRVPPNHISAPIIARVRNDYRAGLLVIALLMTAGIWFSISTTINVFISLIGSEFVTIALIGLNYYSARQRIVQIKTSENWYAGLRQVVMVDTTTHNHPIRLPLLWLVPPIVVLLVTILIAVLRYPALPAIIPIHFGLDGQPNQWSSKLVGVVSTLLPAILVTALLLGLTYFLPRARQQIDPANPAEDALYQRSLRQALGKILIILSTLVNLIFLCTELIITNVLPADSSNRIFSLVIMLVVLLIVAVPVYIVYAVTKNRPAHLAGTASSTIVARDDDQYWRAGMFYYNPEDPALVVEKRIGIGWTLNFGNSQAKIISIIFVIVIVAIALSTFFLKQ